MQYNQPSSDAQPHQVQLGHPKILIVKMSSLGDIIHALPVVHDIRLHFPNAHISWVVESSFAEVVNWHTGIDDVIPVPTRQWKKSLKSRSTWQDIIDFSKSLRQHHYDIVIDLQGLIKSAMVTSIALGAAKHGLNRHVAREPLASISYQHKHHIAQHEHAVIRNRQLSASALGYMSSVEQHPVSYGIRSEKQKNIHNAIIFFHSTTWDNKHWPIEHWVELAKRCSDNGYQVLLPWHDALEKQRANILAQHAQNLTLLPRMQLSELKNIIASCQAAVGLDTGLGHLAAALNVPCLTLFGPTDPYRSRPFGRQQHHLHARTHCAPCMKRNCHMAPKRPKNWPDCMHSITPDMAWSTLKNSLLSPHQDQTQVT